MRVWIEFANCLTHHVSFVNLIFCCLVVWHTHIHTHTHTYTHTHTHTHASQYSETEWDGTRLLALDGQVLMFKLYYIPDQISFLQSTVTRSFVRFVLCLFPRLVFFYRKGSNPSTQGSAFKYGQFSRQTPHNNPKSDLYLRHLGVRDIDGSIVSQAEQNTYSLTFRRLCVTIFAVEKP